MEIGFVGLGKMGGNMVKRLLTLGSHKVVVSDRGAEAVAASVAAGATGATDLADLVKKLAAPRTVWVMVPSGGPTQGVIDQLAALLSPGDLVVDGGNSNFNDSKRRGAQLKEKGIFFADAGT
ncbi:MAG TPA: NAD(P)-binding domain-containing protein, partial [Thermoanaerobaculia bacterium]|nr:NAD(P)-binding domain-containing protein [Thermoanaerobaculia bacterium]